MRHLLLRSILRRGEGEDEEEKENDITDNAHLPQVRKHKKRLIALPVSEREEVMSQNRDINEGEKRRHPR